MYHDFFKLFSLNLYAVSVHNHPASVKVFLCQFSQFLFPDYGSILTLPQSSACTFPDRHISIVHNMHPLYCVSYGSRQTALEKLRWYLNQSHSYEQNHLWDVSLSCEYRSWQSDFSNGRSRITAWVARSLLERSWRTVPVARCITNVSVCFIHLSKNSGESHRLSCVKAEGRTGKEGIATNHALP